MRRSYEVEEVEDLEGLLVIASDGFEVLHRYHIRLARRKELANYLGNTNDQINKNTHPRSHRWEVMQQRIPLEGPLVKRALVENYSYIKENANTMCKWTYPVKLSRTLA